MRLPRLLLLPLLWCVFAFIGRAQSVRWEQADSGLGNALLLVFENCEPAGQPALPAIPGAGFTFAGRSDSTNIVNFQMTRTVALSYIVRSPQNAALRIPEFSVKTNKGDLRVPAFDAARPAIPLDSLANARLLPSRRSIWVGEVFGLAYEISAGRQRNTQFSPNFDWNAAPLAVEDWSKPELTERVVNGESRSIVSFQTRAIAKTANTVKLEAATHLISIQTGTIGLGLFSQPRMEQVTVTSDQPVIEVKSLPAGAPAGFTGAVGQFKLVSKVVPEKAALGEPVTWTLGLSGTGNWPDIEGLPSRTVSNDFQVVQPKAKRTPVEGKLFDLTLTEDVVLVPSKAGNYVIGPVTFAYFDPASGSYKSLTTPRTTLTITPPATPQFSAPPAQTGAAPGTDLGSGEAAPATRKPVHAAAAPTGIPRDPLPGSARARSPLSPVIWLAASVAPWGALGLFWIILALGRARSTDPLRPRREARARLAHTLTRLEAANASTRTALLLDWQRDTALLWQITHAAPPATALDGSDWRTLWAEADRALYGETTTLPSDWVARAHAALAAKSLPGFKPLRLFLPQNLMPFAALLVAGAFTSIAVLRAASADGTISYRKADFAAAESAWRGAIEKTPTDWIARHNLSLALEQQERPGEAAAQAAVAFVQNPAHPAVRWHFARTAEKLGASPAPLVAFVAPGLLQTLAQKASPAQWQLGAIFGSLLVAVGVGALLAQAYSRVSPLLRWPALALLGLGVALTGCAVAGVHAYGTAANGDAVIVARAISLRSIPTEVDTTQKSSPLSAGSLALTDKSFLGWRRLVFDHGQTGWVRKEEIVPIWK